MGAELCILGPVPSSTLPIHFAVPKLEKTRLMHHLPPAAAAVLGGQLLGVSIGNPAPSQRDRCPSVNSQRSGGVPQFTNDPRRRPIYGAIRCDAVDDRSWNASDWTNSAVSRRT